MTSEQMAQTLYELQQQNIQTAEYISVLAAENEQLRQRAEKAESDNIRIGNICQDLRMACSQFSRAQQKAEAGAAVLRILAKQMLASIGSATCSIGGLNDHYRNHPVRVDTVSRWRTILTDTQAGAKAEEVLRAAVEWQDCFYSGKGFLDTREALLKAVDAYREGSENE